MRAKGFHKTEPTAGERGERSPMAAMLGRGRVAVKGVTPRPSPLSSGGGVSAFVFRGYVMDDGSISGQGVAP